MGCPGRKGACVFGQDRDKHACIGLGLIGAGVLLLFMGERLFPLGIIMILAGMIWAGLLGHIAPLAMLVVAPFVLPFVIRERLKEWWRGRNP